jgi:hypothetical protein
MDEKKQDLERGTRMVIKTEEDRWMKQKLEHGTWNKKERERMKGDGYQETGSGTRNRAKRERMTKRTEGDGYKEKGLGTRAKREMRLRKRMREMDKRNRIWNKEHRAKRERMRKRTEGD